MAKKRRIRYDRLIPLVILALLLLYLIISLLINLLFGGGRKKQDDNIYTLCNLSARKTLQLVEKEDRQNVAMLKDYNFYGESLNLYYDVYDREMGTEKTLDGQTIALVDMCSDNVIRFDVTKDVDNQINIAKLTPGFYSVYTVKTEGESEVFTRLYFDRSVYSDNIAYSVTRDNKRIKVELVANKKLFDAADAEESVLDQPYLYLNVTSEDVDPTAANIEYDVAVVTAPALTERGVSLVGEEANGYVEAKELWDVAEQLKAKLEAYDMKVMMGKDAYDEDIIFYDTNGVAHKAYKGNVKYIIYLDMTTDDNYVETLYSSFASDALARSIYMELVEVGLYQGGELSSSYVETDGLAGPVDAEYEIRETGGKPLGAGSYSEWSRVNAPFAANNIHGINTVKIVTANIRNSTAMQNWSRVKDQVADAILRGFMNYLNR